MSNKKRFTRHPSPDNFIQRERKSRPHLPHSVALLILSPNDDQVATAIPGSAVSSGVDYIQSPPQLRMTAERVNAMSPFAPSDAYQTVQGTAMTVAREFLNMSEITEYHHHHHHHFSTVSGNKSLKKNRLWYVGSTRGNRHQDGGQVVQYGRYVHWVLMRTDRYKDVFRNDSVHFQKPQWVNTARLASLPQAQLMSQRKLEMIDQALLMYYQVTGDYNKLVAKAINRSKQLIAA